MQSDSIEYFAKINLLVKAYLRTWPQESSRLAVLQKQLSDGDMLLNHRSNMIGHLTASALLVSPDKNCLLILHKALGRWLQPGGHLDPGELPEDGARRELLEETGVVVAQSGLAFIDLDSHQIPPSTKKNEAAHLHHDFQFVFTVSSEAVVSIEPAEVSAFKWAPLSELASGQYGSRLARVAGKLIDSY